MAAAPRNTLETCNAMKGMTRAKSMERYLFHDIGYGI
jgi:hypothetical protein